MRYVKIVVKGKSLVQPIINILYYSALPENPVGFAVEELEGLAKAVYEAWRDNVKPHMGAFYGIPYVEAVQVDEHGRTNGAVTITYTTGDLPNGYGASTDTHAVCAILKFNTQAQTTLMGSRRPSRSYLALGPLPSGAVDNDGTITWNPPTQASILASVVQGHLVGTSVFQPYRVSLTSPSAQPRVGRVVGGSINYKASVRRSRLNRRVE